MIKPNFFMQNLLGSAGTIKEQGKFFLPMGQGKTVMIDTRDIGACVAVVMTTPGHESQAYELTGPEELGFADAAERFTTVLGRKIEYVHVPMPAYRQTLARFLTNEWHLNAVCELFQEIADGQDLHVTEHGAEAHRARRRRRWSSSSGITRPCSPPDGRRSAFRRDSLRRDRDPFSPEGSRLKPLLLPIDGDVGQAAVLVDGVVDEDRRAAHGAVLHVGLVALRQVQQQRDGLPAVGALDGDFLEHLQNLSLRRRVSPSTSTSGGGAAGMPSVARSSGLAGRRNGLVAFSRPMVLGTVGWPAARSAATSAPGPPAPRSRGSIVTAKRPLLWVYSWAQYTRTSSGSAISFCRDCPHLGRRALEEPAAAQREERVADEGGLVGVEHVADVADGVARGLQDPRLVACPGRSGRLRPPGCRCRECAPRRPGSPRSRSRSSPSAPGCRPRGRSGGGYSGCSRASSPVPRARARWRRHRACRWRPSGRTSGSWIR